MAKRTASEAAETRRQIIEEATRVFAMKGYANTGTGEIAKALGMTDGALYHHFESKLALFEIVCQELHEELHERIYEAGIPAASRRHSFQLCVEATVRLTSQERYQRIIFLEGPMVLSATKWRAADAKLGMALIENGLRFVAEAPEIPDRLVKPIAMVVLGTMNELTYALIRGDPGIDVDECIETLMAMVDDWLVGPAADWKASQPGAIEPSLVTPG